jgi:predicted choloylglycine hydrolase
VRALLDDPDLTRERFIAAFLEPPLHNTEYVQGFGTIYTAAYHPTEGRVEYRWPGSVWEQSFDRFEETEHTQTFIEHPPA